MPPRDRQAHGEGLLDQLNQANAEEQQRRARAAANPAGIVLDFLSAPEFELQLKSLEAEKQGIELLNVTTDGDVTLATVFIPNGKLAYFSRRFERYLNEDTRTNRPKHRALVESISGVRRAALRSFWTDNADFPPEDRPLDWEVWLRTTPSAEAALNVFRAEAESLGLTLGRRVIQFPDRLVLLAHGTAAQLGSSLQLLDVVAELRLAKECPTDFLSRHMQRPEQAEWAREAAARVVAPPADAVAVCVLDTGVDLGQPLLAHAIDEEHTLTCFPEASPADHAGHGTEMAGLSLYGDLSQLLMSTERVALRHRLESVKILPRAGSNPPDLYGAITAEAVYRIEQVEPHRRRVFCMAVAATDSRDRGQPSSWSGELDQIAFGEDASPKRLVFVCAGNTDQSQRHNYPDSNHTDGIHDPGQAWNAITVGAFTERVLIRSEEFAAYEPVAPSGALSPSSTTSLVWQQSWPLKPDIVMEGGNSAVSPARHGADTIEDLQLLSTSRLVAGKLFVATGDTSAATALAARVGAVIQAEYPEYWPETVRALMIHSAEWTPAMLEEFPPPTKQECQRRMRCYGYGVPSLDRALWCARNALCLVSQAELYPYERDEDASRVKTRDMHLYDLPWPVDELRELGEQEVTMRVTLSYFIEPSPGRRGWKYRHRYASHGLRFDVKRPLERVDDFRKRLNKMARDEEEELATTEGQEWTLGQQLRSRGSIHSDWWTGTASELADCGHLGIYPITGWWRERPQFERYTRPVRYALIVSIHTPAQDVDLYTPVTIQLGIPTTISIE
ncbi:S8 family peptidase [Tautonia sociabilis]|nr:S8 family peptidase [Tautonia sociabilis]